MKKRTSTIDEEITPTETPDTASVDERASATVLPAETLREEDLVPGWLALLVLVLLLAVTALGGFVLRGVLTKDTAITRSGYAVSELEAKVKADPDDIESILSLGYAYQQDGQFQNALDEYAKVLERDPQNLAALYNKGAVLSELGDAKKAEQAYWDTLKIAPDHALAAKALGEMYLAQKHYKSALVAVDPVLETRPDLADLQYISGFANEQLGNTEKAIERYRAAAKFDLVEARDALRRLGVKE
ncbi:MAG: tetratricopeptide repeat protein [Actinobacteria bacterium]|nr:MAG: tetratricopeptide repeat protein [Actinomycetota bacterium]